jgi:hypothetical protein
LPIYFFRRRDREQVRKSYVATSRGLDSGRTAGNHDHHGIWGSG